MELNINTIVIVIIGVALLSFLLVFVRNKFVDQKEQFLVNKTTCGNEISDELETYRNSIIQNYVENGTEYTSITVRDREGDRIRLLKDKIVGELSVGDISLFIGENDSFECFHGYPQDISLKDNLVGMPEVCNIKQNVTKEICREEPIDEIYLSPICGQRVLLGVYNMSLVEIPTIPSNAENVSVNCFSDCQNSSDAKVIYCEVWGQVCDRDVVNIEYSDDYPWAIITRISTSIRVEDFSREWLDVMVEARECECLTQFIPCCAERDWGHCTTIIGIPELGINKDTELEDCEDDQWECKKWTCGSEDEYIVVVK